VFSSEHSAEQTEVYLLGMLNNYQIYDQWRSQKCVMEGVLARSPYPLSPLSPSPFPFHSLPLEVGLFKSSWGSGEHCELPQRGLGWRPSRNRNLVHFSLKIRHLVAAILIFNHCFCSITKQQKCTPFSTEGVWTPKPPLWLRYCIRLSNYSIIFVFICLAFNSRVILKICAYIDSCEVCLGEFLQNIIRRPAKVDFQAMANILVVHSQSSGREYAAAFVLHSCVCWFFELDVVYKNMTPLLGRQVVCPVISPSRTIQSREHILGNKSGKIGECTKIKSTRWKIQNNVSTH